jgi:transcriptional regulator with XRE-family HTH domain
MPAATEIGNGKDPRIALGNAVYRQRMKLGISQEDFADQVGLDRTYISGIERGIRNPTLLVLLRLAQVLAVPVAQLLEDDTEETEPSP